MINALVISAMAGAITRDEAVSRLVDVVTDHGDERYRDGYVDGQENGYGAITWPDSYSHDPWTREHAGSGGGE